MVNGVGNSWDGVAAGAVAIRWHGAEAKRTFSVVVLVVDIVADSNEFLVFVRARNKQNCHSQEVFCRNLARVRGRRLPVSCIPGIPNALDIPRCVSMHSNARRERELVSRVRVTQIPPPRVNSQQCRWSPHQRTDKSNELVPAATGPTRTVSNSWSNEVSAAEPT